MDNRDKILRLLFENREGLGYNELKQLVYEKSITKYRPELLRSGLVTIKKVKTRGGIKYLHMLTSEGIRYVEKSIFNENFLKMFLTLREKNPPKISVLQEKVQKYLDDNYEQRFVAWFLTKSEYLEFKDWFKKNKDGVILWRKLTENNGEKEPLG